MERRFQPVLVEAPSVEETIGILRGLKERYEIHHGVRITDAALIGAAVLSDRYVTGRHLPDKAIDLVDEAASKLRIEIDSMPDEIDELERRRRQLEIEKQALSKEDDKASQERLGIIEEDLANLGEKLDALRAEMPDRFASGEFSMDFSYDGVYEGVYKERQYGAAQALYDAVSITRKDKIRRNEQFMRNFIFFDAPHVAFLFLPEPFGLREAADLGMYAQTLMLTLTAHGLGSCPQTALSFQADYIREQLDIAPDNKLVFGLSFGYPDPDAPANACITDRATVADAITFHS